MRRVAIVTGAAGFLGSHLSEHLLDDGWSVVGVDNFMTGRKENLAQLMGNPRFSFVRADVRRKVRLPPAEGIFHLASPASPPYYQRFPIETLEVNGFGTSQMLSHAHACGARMVFSSTSEVYGDPEVHPQTEDYWGHVNPVGVRSCYDEGKRYGEALCMAWLRARETDVRIARIFNTYGPRMAPDDGRVISNFFVQGWKGEPMTIQGTGMQTRSFCYVSDLVAGLIALFHADRVDGPVNLGNPGEEMTILSIAQQIRTLTGGRSEIVHVERGKDDPERRRPDIRKAKRLLGWAPKVPLDKGLVPTGEYFKLAVGAEKQ
jgi:nucleoside-diphosphate-sugar epimerase